jgi:hypothetical protein
LLSFLSIPVSILCVLLEMLSFIRVLMYMCSHNTHLLTHSFTRSHTGANPKQIKPSPAYKSIFFCRQAKLLYLICPMASLSARGESTSTSSPV